MKATVLIAPATPPESPLASPPTRSPQTQRMLDGPILPTLLRLAAPNVVLVVVQAASSAVDAFYLGRLGPPVLAGVALVFPLWTLMVTMSAGGIGGAIASSIARALGAGRREEANVLVSHSLVLVVGLSLVFSASVLLGGRLLFGWMGGSGEALDAALAYATVVFSGALAVWLVNGLPSVLRGSGDMVFPAAVIVAGEVLHIVLAPILIFGLGLGVTGAGLSLVISYTLRAVALAAYLLARRAGVSLPRHHALRLRRSLFWEILRVGLPGSLNTLLTSFNVIVVTSLVGASGVYALAGYGLAARLEFLQIPLVFGFGSALVTLVGVNIGAGQVQRARRVAWVGAGVAALVTGTVGAVVAIAPQVWLDLFTNDPAVMDVGASYLHLVGPSYALFGLGLALYFAAQGAGRLGWPLAASFGRLIIVLVGGWVSLYWLNLGLSGLFAAIALSFVAFGIAQAVAANFALRGR